jgi:hypothetical protein
MWTLVGIVAGLVTVGVLLVVVVIARRRDDTSQLGAEMTADQWFTLGVILAGAGAALTATIGVWMIWMVAMGVIYMGVGIRMKRNGDGDRTSTGR